MKTLSTLELNNFEKWIKCWNTSYPVVLFTDEERGHFPDLFPYAKDYNDISSQVLEEVKTNISNLETNEEYKDYQSSITTQLSGLQDWINDQGISKTAFVKNAKPALKAFENDEKDVPTADHIYQCYSDSVSKLQEKLNTIFENLSPIHGEVAKSKSVYIEEIKSAHLHILMHVISEKLNQPKKYPKTLIAEILAQSFLRSNGEYFSPAKIRKSSSDGPSETEMKQVASVLENMATTIKDEIEKEPMKYFSEVS